MNAISDWTLIVVAVLGFSAGVMIGWLIGHHAFSCLRAALKKSAKQRMALTGDLGQLSEEVSRLEAYAAELEQSERQTKKELAIAIESSDRWREEAFDTQNKLAEVTELLATEKRRAAALMGWNRIYRREKTAPLVMAGKVAPVLGGGPTPESIWGGPGGGYLDGGGVIGSSDGVIGGGGRGKK